MARVDWDDARVRKACATIAWNAHVPNLEKAARDSVAGEAPVDTGNLRDVVALRGTRRIPNAGPLGLAAIRVEADTPYAYIVHEGRGEVTPNPGTTALHWINKLGNSVFAQRSKAVPPNRFIVRGLEKIGLRVKRLDG